MKKNELIKQYIKEQGESFNIKHIDMYRDGGTMLVEFVYIGDTEIQKVYVDKECKGVFWDYKKTQQITNKPFTAYFSERLENYIGHLEFKISMAKRISKIAD